MKPNGVIGVFFLSHLLVGDFYIRREESAKDGRSFGERSEGGMERSSAVQVVTEAKQSSHNRSEPLSPFVMRTYMQERDQGEFHSSIVEGETHCHRCSFSCACASRLDLLFSSVLLFVRTRVRSLLLKLCPFLNAKREVERALDGARATVSRGATKFGRSKENGSRPQIFPVGE